MTVQKLKDIILKKAKELWPDASSYSAGLEIKSDYKKITIRVHTMAFYNKPVDEDKTFRSQWYEKNTVAECIAHMDMLIHDYKKTEKIDLE